MSQFKKKQRLSTTHILCTLFTLGSLATLALSGPAQPLFVRQDDPAAYTVQCVSYNCNCYCAYAGTQNQYGTYVPGTIDSCSSGASGGGWGGYGTQPTPNPSDPGNPGPPSNNPDNGTNGGDGGDAGAGGD